MTQTTEIKQEINRLNKQFLHSSDFVAKEIMLGKEENVIICYYSSLVNKTDLEKNLLNLKQLNLSASPTNEDKNQNTDNTKSSETEKDEFNEKSVEQKQLSKDDTITITKEKYDQQRLVDYVCNGETLIIFLQSNELIRLNNAEFAHKTPEEPENEQILRGSHEGFVENFEVNVQLIRKRIKNNNLVVKQIVLGKETKTNVYYFYVENVVDKGALETVETRLNAIDTDTIYSLGQINDYLDDQVWSPFPQLLNTERPDRVVANILEGKVAIMSDLSPTALIGPVTFFSFYQTPDDFNSRVFVGTFYRLMRLFSILSAIFLPAFYIAIVSFHFEVLPLELANKVKSDINQIPYRPLIEAMIMEITIELIREASVRLPKSIGQTIGIVGGLVIGDAIVSAGLVSNLMVIVVAFTAISSFVVPSVELNTSIRMLRFPFMFLASLFGFFGIVIGTFLLVVHLLNLSSLKRPYLSPIIPFDPIEVRKIFFRGPYYGPTKQATSFSPKKDDKA
ncbi:spore germination protein [Solibacillus sp. FSL W8-0372]|uniref:spore germination protein n=1 Tax=Solibacillus sp. FSL W8-0372 TaxID=2921713 RepID=UPI0030D502FC